MLLLRVGTEASDIKRIYRSYEERQYEATENHEFSVALMNIGSFLC